MILSPWKGPTPALAAFCWHRPVVPDESMTDDRILRSTGLTPLLTMAGTAKNEKLKRRNKFTRFKMKYRHWSSFPILWWSQSSHLAWDRPSRVNKPVWQHLSQSKFAELIFHSINENAFTCHGGGYRQFYNCDIVFHVTVTPKWMTGPLLGGKCLPSQTAWAVDIVSTQNNSDVDDAIEAVSSC